MTIEDILSVLEKEASAEADAIMQEAYARAEEIESAARKDGEHLIEARIASAEEAARREATAAFTRAQMRQRSADADDESEAVERAFELAHNYLKALRSSPEYSRIFEALAVEAFEGATGGCELHVTPEDGEHAEKVFQALFAETVRVNELPDDCKPGEMRSTRQDSSAQVKVIPDLSSAGGVIVVCADGRVVRNNTFESRLEKLRRTARNDVAEVLNG